MAGSIASVNLEPVDLNKSRNTTVHQTPSQRSGLDQYVTSRKLTVFDRMHRLFGAVAAVQAKDLAAGYRRIAVLHGKQKLVSEEEMQFISQGCYSENILTFEWLWSLSH